MTLAKLMRSSSYFAIKASVLIVTAMVLGDTALLVVGIVSAFGALVTAKMGD